MIRFIFILCLNFLKMIYFINVVLNNKGFYNFNFFYLFYLNIEKGLNVIWEIFWWWLGNFKNLVVKVGVVDFVLLF